MKFIATLSLGFALLFANSASAGIRDNIHTVEDGKLYRSAQLEEKKLEKLVHEKGIKTIINLRGNKTGEKWYDDEVAVAARNNVILVDIGMSAKRLPHKKDLLALLKAYEDVPRPILIHCRAGVDRTGEAAAIYQMLYMGKTKKEALKMLSPKYGHFEMFMPAKKYFIRELWQGVEWANNQYDPCSGQYKYYDANSAECKSDGGGDEDGDS